MTSHQNAGGRSERTQEPSKNGRGDLDHLRNHQGPPLFPLSLFNRIAAQSPRAYLGCTKCFAPSIQHNLGLPRTRHQHSCSHTVLIHSLHVSKPSQYCLIHLLANSLSIKALQHTSSSLTLFIRDIPANFKHENIHFLHLHTSYSPYLCSIQRR